MSPKQLPTAAEVLAEAYDLVDSDPVRAGVLLGIARELREGSRPFPRTAPDSRPVRDALIEIERVAGAMDAGESPFGHTLDGAPAYNDETATQRVGRIVTEATEQFPRLWLNTLQTETGPRPADVRFGMREFFIPSEQIGTPKIVGLIAQSPAQGECGNCSQDVYEAAIFSPEGGSTTEWRHRATGQRACVFPESVDVKTEADPAA